MIKTQEQLIEVIRNMDFEKQKEHTKQLKEQYIVTKEKATERVVKMIFEGEK